MTLCRTFACLLLVPAVAFAADDAPLPKTTLEGTGEGWVALGEADFTQANCDPETFTWKDGLLSCTGTPVGVLRTKKQYGNFEMVVNWKHLKSAGNSGVFVWTTEESLKDLKRNALPKGIEVQILDHGYKTNYEKSGKKADWFTTNGDVFAVGVKMTPYPPLSPNGSRSFPKKELSKGFGEWNHYYIRAVDGEVKLWVNGEQVSGGHDCDPKSGFLCLESEGSPIEFKNIRIHELP